MAAATFSKAAAAAGVERIVYLGGVAPVGTGSDHLRSRLDVGEALRAGSVKTIELRASMIVGHRSLSWLIVRDLAARLPFMPTWPHPRLARRHRTQRRQLGAERRRSKMGSRT